MLLANVGKNSFDLIKHPAIETHDEIKKICRPIFDLFEITFFRYLRVYPDNSRIHLCSNPDWTELFYAKGLYNVAWFDANKMVDPKSIEILWDVKASSDDNIVGLEARNHFNIHHGMSIIRPQKSYYEVYDLATHKNNQKINETYLNNLELFERFFFYFKDQARNILNRCEKNRIILPNLNKCLEIPNEKYNVTTNAAVDKFLKITDTKRFYINTFRGDVYLTKREIECIHWILMGKSAEEIGIILKCSKRTVEIHLNNTKHKLGVSKIAQVTKMVIDSGIMEASKFDWEKK